MKKLHMGCDRLSILFTVRSDMEKLVFKKNGMYLPFLMSLEQGLTQTPTYTRIHTHTLTHTDHLPGDRVDYGELGGTV